MKSARELISKIKAERDGEREARNQEGINEERGYEKLSTQRRALKGTSSKLLFSTPLAPPSHHLSSC